jgi:glycerophosphoryl diester phosphodiesterase
VKNSLDLGRCGHPLAIAHRGYSARFPENTLAAFRGAMEAGCDMIELDVTLTQDRRVVVIHDDRLERTTDGRGRVRDHGLAAISALDAGSWFDPKFAGERVPELSAVMALVSGRCLLNIEIKAGAFEPDGPPDAIERQVVDLAHGHGALGWVLVSSFEPRFLERIAARPSPPALAFISDSGAGPEVMDLLRRVSAFSWHPNVGCIDRGQVGRVQAAGMRVFPWTVRTRRQAEDAVALGVDGLIVNELELARGFRD